MADDRVSWLTILVTEAEIRKGDFSFRKGRKIGTVQRIKYCVTCATRIRNSTTRLLLSRRDKLISELVREKGRAGCTWADGGRNEGGASEEEKKRRREGKREAEMDSWNLEGKGERNKESGSLRSKGEPGGWSCAAQQETFNSVTPGLNYHAETIVSGKIKERSPPVSSSFFLLPPNRSFGKSK